MLSVLLTKWRNLWIFLSITLLGRGNVIIITSVTCLASRTVQSPPITSQELILTWDKSVTIISHLLSSCRLLSVTTGRSSSATSAKHPRGGTGARLVGRLPCSPPTPPSGTSWWSSLLRTGREYPDWRREGREVCSKGPCHSFYLKILHRGESGPQL